MPKVDIGLPAPDFELADLRGVPFRLSERRDTAYVLLVFNRGFK